MNSHIQALTAGYGYPAGAKSPKILDAPSSYGVDAHALQHPEIHGKKNNAVHLLRLSWIFEYKEYGRSGTVPKWWQEYTQRSDIPHLEPPQERGKLTVVDVAGAKTPKAHAELMQQWALTVYEAWHSHHAWARSELRRIFK